MGESIFLGYSVFGGGGAGYITGALTRYIALYSDFITKASSEAFCFERSYADLSQGGVREGDPQNWKNLAAVQGPGVPMWQRSGWEVLPATCLSLLLPPDAKLSSRLGASRGYKAISQRPSPHMGVPQRCTRCISLYRVSEGRPRCLGFCQGSQVDGSGPNRLGNVYVSE